LLEKAEKDTGMQDDLLAACVASQLFYINAFCMTYHQFDVDKMGQRIESKHPDQPMITWDIQDKLLLSFEDAIDKGEDRLNLEEIQRKGEEMGAAIVVPIMRLRTAEEVSTLLKMGFT